MFKIRSVHAQIVPNKYEPVKFNSPSYYVSCKRYQLLTNQNVWFVLLENCTVLNQSELSNFSFILLNM